MKHRVRASALSLTALPLAIMVGSTIYPVNISREAFGVWLSEMLSFPLNAWSIRDGLSAVMQS